MLRLLEPLLLCLFIGANAVVISCVVLAGVADRKSARFNKHGRSGDTAKGNHVP
jgi:hypothetical protein